MKTQMRRRARTLASRAYRVVPQGLSLLVPDPMDARGAEGTCDGRGEEEAEEDRVRYIEDGEDGWAAGNVNALRQGSYSRAFTEEELVEIGRSAVAELAPDEEIAMLRVLTPRVLEAKPPARDSEDIVSTAMLNEACVRRKRAGHALDLEEVGRPPPLVIRDWIWLAASAKPARGEQTQPNSPAVSEISHSLQI